jgi:hypothetical protein
MEMRHREALLRWTAGRAHGALRELADELPYAAPEDREALQAGIEFERWLLENCQAVWESRAP